MEKLYLNSNLHSVIKRDEESGMLNHAYLLISTDRNLVNEFAKCVACEIMCEQKRPCFECVACKRVKNGTHSDVETYPTNDKPILTDDVNKIVSESYVLPLEADKKIYILKDFDLATIQAQNKLLKTLEEPPKSVVFVLTTSNENNILPTVKSRCKKVTIPQLDEAQLADYLVRNHSKTEAEAKELATLSGGSVTTALKYIKNANLLQLKTLCDNIILRLSSSDQVLKCGYELMNTCNDLEEFLNLMTEALSELMQKFAKGEKVGLTSKEIVLMSEKVQESIKRLKSNCNPNAVVDGLLMGILEVKYLCRK